MVWVVNENKNALSSLCTFTIHGVHVAFAIWNMYYFYLLVFLPECMYLFDISMLFCNKEVYCCKEWPTDHERQWKVQQAPSPFHFNDCRENVTKTLKLRINCENLRTHEKYFLLCFGTFFKLMLQRPCKLLRLRTWKKYIYLSIGVA